MSTPDIEPIRVLIAGGSYAGLSALVALLNYSHGSSTEEEVDVSQGVTPPVTPRRRVLLRIDLVDERDGYLYLIGCPLAFASRSYAEKIWVPYSTMPVLKHPDVTIHRATVLKVDPDSRTATIRSMDEQATESTLGYDYFVAATGLRRSHPVVPSATTKAAYVAEVEEHVGRVRAALDLGLVVIGGGAVGIEMAGEARVMFPDLKVVLIHSRLRLLAAEPLPDEVGDAALQALREEGIEVILGQRAVGDDEVEVEGGRRGRKLTLADGSSLLAGHVIYALSRQVSTASYLPAWCLDADGLIKADTSFRFLPGHKHDAHHVACGDIIAWSGIKRCGGAIHSAARLADNVYQQMLFELDGLPPKTEPWPVDVPGMIGLAIGKQALGYHPDTGLKVGEDQLAYLFKDDLAFNGCYTHMQLGKVWQ